MGTLASRIGVSAGFIHGRLGLLSFPDDVKTALGSKLINLSVAKELAKVDDPAERVRLMTCAIDNGATGTTVCLWVLDYLRVAGYRPAAEKIEGFNGDEKTATALLGIHPTCDCCAGSLAGTRRVMLIWCGGCWEAWTSQKVQDKAAEVIAQGSDALKQP